MFDGRPEARNLVGIYGAVTGESVEDVLARFAGQGFGAFKPALADALVALLSPIRADSRSFAGTRRSSIEFSPTVPHARANSARRCSPKQKPRWG